MSRSTLTPWKHATLVVFLGVSTTGCVHSGGLRGNESEMRSAIARLAPPGTTVDAAMKTMTAAGYRCAAIAGQPKIECAATSLMQDSDWRVTFTINDGVVIDSTVGQWNTFL